VRGRPLHPHSHTHAYAHRDVHAYADCDVLSHFGTDIYTNPHPEAPALSALGELLKIMVLLDFRGLALSSHRIANPAGLNESKS
jgi:hypothetical protein